MSGKSENDAKEGGENENETLLRGGSDDISVRVSSVGQAQEGKNDNKEGKKK